jgi:hypothetical protein
MKSDLKSPLIEPLESRIAPAVFVLTTLSDSAPTGRLREAIAAQNLQKLFP